MLDAERAAFLARAGLRLEGLTAGGTMSGRSTGDGADLAPRPARVRTGLSSCEELRVCAAREGAFLGAGIGQEAGGSG